MRQRSQDEPVVKARGQSQEGLGTGGDRGVERQAGEPDWAGEAAEWWREAGRSGRSGSRVGLKMGEAESWEMRADKW